MSEFIDTMHKFAGQSSDEKLVFLFRVYDLDGKFLILQILIIISVTSNGGIFLVNIISVWFY